jgi:pyridoxal/pyridoxine/pyridoxamine kinase
MHNLDFGADEVVCSRDTPDGKWSLVYVNNRPVGKGDIFSVISPPLYDEKKLTELTSELTAIVERYIENLES